MTGFTMLAPFAVAAIITLSSIAATLRSALPRIAQLRAELEGCRDTQDYSFRVTSVIGRWNDGTVVTLPARAPIRTQRLPARQLGLRAAA